MSMESQKEKSAGESAKRMLWIAEIVCNEKKFYRTFYDVTICGAWLANFQWFGQFFGIDVHVKIIAKEVEER